MEKILCMIMLRKMLTSGRMGGFLRCGVPVCNTREYIRCDTMFGIWVHLKIALKNGSVIFWQPGVFWLNHSWSEGNCFLSTADILQVGEEKSSCTLLYPFLIFFSKNTSSSHLISDLLRRSNFSANNLWKGSF